MALVDLFLALYILLAIAFGAMAFVQVRKPRRRYAGFGWLLLAILAVVFNVPNFIPTGDNNIRVDLVCVDFVLLPVFAIVGLVGLAAEYRRFRRSRGNESVVEERKKS